MRALLRCDAPDGLTDWPALLGIRIAGLPLLERHFRAFKAAGIDNVLLRTTSPQNGMRQLAERLAPEGMTVSFGSEDGEEARLEVRADTLVDPRLIRELVRIYALSPCELVCADSYPDNYPSADKSPYRVGAAGPDELREAGERDCPIGVSVLPPDSAEPQAPRRLAVGKYYWHRLTGPVDVPEASRKIFLSTMKATDGIYARTNRRVSIPISRLLVQTPITPNMVTLIALGCSVGGAWMYSQGTYSTMVAGSFASWFASMLDGCDGEVARVKFQTSEFGAWFEMVCDYLYYVVMFFGMGLGVARYTGNPLWNWVGIGSVVGTILSFLVVARLKSRHAKHGSSADFGRALQSRLGSRASNALHFFSRHAGFFITRAAAPYFILVFTILGLAPWIMGLTLLGTNLAWSLALYASPLFRDFDQAASKKQPG